VALAEYNIWLKPLLFYFISLAKAGGNSIIISLLSFENGFSRSIVYVRD